MKNQVIRVLNKEHGKKVIQYWKDRGINTGGFSGSIPDWYYGVIDGEFNTYSSKEVAKAVVEVITLPELPEKWFIVPTKDTVKDICKWFDENHNNGSDCNFYSNELNMETAYYSNAFTKSDVYYSIEYLINRGIPEITFEQFKQITGMKEEKKIISYKLVKPEYADVVDKIGKTTLNGRNAKAPSTINNLKEAGVLDLWFEPVYEEEAPQLPIINCYSGNIINNKVVYGCVQVPFSWFKDPFNEKIASLTLNRGTVINREQMEQIRKVIDYHHNKK